MEIVSPYGKNVTQELREVYKLESLDALLGRVRCYLAESYGFQPVVIEQVHVAFGIAVRFSYQEQLYYLKFTGRANHQQPEALFEYHNYLRRHGIPLPEILQTVNRTHFETILESPWYDVTYVMKAVRGRVMGRKTALRLGQYVRVIAEVHRLGVDYEPRVISGYRNVHDFFREAVEGLADLTFTASHRRLLEQATGSARDTLADLKRYDDLSKTHIHGDFRLCHVMFDQGGVSGVIDAEHLTYAERLWDVCVGSVSHPNPVRCLLLELGEVLSLLKLYDRLYPLTKADRRTLKGVLQLALLNELAGILLFLGTGQSEANLQDARRLWKTLEHVEGLPSDLGL